MRSEISATEMARNLSDLLNRVRYRGETFEIVRGGEVVAQIGPAASRPRATVADLAAALRRVARSDDSFARDLERIQDQQPQLPDDPWAS